MTAQTLRRIGLCKYSYDSLRILSNFASYGRYGTIWKTGGLATTLNSSSFLTNSSIEIPSQLHTFEQVDGEELERELLPPSSMVWIDMEMTGLDFETEAIMELACVITDQDLNIVAETEDMILKVDDEKLDNMVEWCQYHHGQSGLKEACRKSELSVAEAEEKMLTFLQAHIPERGAPLAGNSVHADKAFLDKYMPRFMGHLHYRIIDVSTIKELAKRWHPKEYKNAPRKGGSHRARDDIIESIEELKYYRTTLFKG